MKPLKIMGIFGIILICVMALVFYKMQSVKSASTLTIDPHQADINTSTDYCIGGYIDSLDAGDFIDLDFDDNYDLSNLNISDTAAQSEVTLYIGTNTCTGGTARIAEAGADDQANRDVATVDLGTNTVRIVMESGYSPGATFISAKFNDLDPGGGTNGSIITPASAGNYKLIARVGQSSDDIPDEILLADLLHIGGANQTTITAEVDPTLTLYLSATACDLGVFDDSYVNTCNYYVRVSTQATNGYTAYIRDDGDFTNATDDVIGDATDGSDGDSDPDVEAGVEEYGVASTEDLSVDINRLNNADGLGGIDVDDCIHMDGNTITANSTALTQNDQSFSTATAAVSNDTVYMCHAASITGTTEAGIYSHTVTVTIVANF